MLVIFSRDCAMRRRSGLQRFQDSAWKRWRKKGNFKSILAAGTSVRVAKQCVCFAVWPVCAHVKIALNHVSTNRSEI